MITYTNNDNELCRENEGTERDIEGTGWDLSIPLQLSLVLLGNGSLFPWQLDVGRRDQWQKQFWLLKIKNTLPWKVALTERNNFKCQRSD